MSYRKITVDDKQYEYVIGKTHTKIKGLGLYPNIELGDTVKKPGFIGGPDKTFITPGMIADVIRGKKPRSIHETKSMQRCRHTSTPYTVANPFDAEIYGKRVPMIACEECYEQAADDI